MARKIVTSICRIALVTLLLAAVLLSERLVSFSSYGWLGAVAIEVRAACRDPGTQWMVFLCAGIYFVTFSLLGKRGARNAECGTGGSTADDAEHADGPNHRSSIIHHKSPDTWLFAFILIAALRYAFDYERASASTQALVLLAGAAMGKGARLWADWQVSGARCQVSGAGSAESTLRSRLATEDGRSAEHRTSNIEHRTSNAGNAELGTRSAERTASTTKHTNGTKAVTEGAHSLAKHSPADVLVNLQRSTFNLQRLLTILVLLLAIAALWHPEGAMQFQYRGLSRWSGPWDNPNIFGLLMGVGVVIAAGMVVRGVRCQVSGAEGQVSGSESGVSGAGKHPTTNIEHPTSDASVRRLWSAVPWSRGLGLVVIVACGTICGIGLLKSYSRGAWLGTACGLVVLAYHAFGHRASGSEQRASRGQVSGGEGADTHSPIHSCNRFKFFHLFNPSPLQPFNFLHRHLRPLSVVLWSVVVLAFWQFRYTEFHPVRRAFSVGNQNDFSWRNRVAAWEGALAMMADKPFTGFGWNQPERIYDQLYRPPKVSEGMAIQLNHYFTLGMSLGLPALICFAAYIGLSLTRSVECGMRNGEVLTTKLASQARLQIDAQNDKATSRQEVTEHTKRETEECSFQDVSISDLQHLPQGLQSPAKHSPADVRNLQPTTCNLQAASPSPSSVVSWSSGPGTREPDRKSEIANLKWVCRGAAVVLLVGLWFDGGLFNLATGALLWTLLELGRPSHFGARPSRSQHVAHETACEEEIWVDRSGHALRPGVPRSADEALPRIPRFQFFAVPLLFCLILGTGLIWAKGRDPFHREWLSLKMPDDGRLSAVAVMPDRGGPFPVVVWCQGSGGSMERSGETLRQFATLGLAAVGFEYDKTNQAGFDAQFAAVLDEIARQPWAAKARETRSAERGVRNSTLETRNLQLETSSEHPTSNIQQPTSNLGQPTPDPSQEGNGGIRAGVNGLNREWLNEGSALETTNRKSSIVNHQSVAWVGNSLGAQRQLSLLARHPERQPAVLVRLSGGMVEELGGNAERGTRSAEQGGLTTKEDEHPTSNTQQPTSSKGRIAGVNGLNGEWLNEEDAAQTANRKSQIVNHKSPIAGPLSVVTWSSGPPLTVWLAHGENDEVFPASDARQVAAALRAAGADVRLDVFPGRGHGFGEDQPLLVRRAAEFCARELGATAGMPDNVRPSLWGYWLPVGLGLVAFGGACFGNRSSRPVLRSRATAEGGRESAPYRPAFRWSGLTSAATRMLAGATLVLAALVSAAHLALPLLPVNQTTAKLAGHWCVRPELRSDFDWLVSQPGAKGCHLRELLEHLNLAALQRGQFTDSLSDADWRAYVLSPWIDGAGEDIGWRRELWETLYPRIRRETDAEAAAVQVVRQLSLRVRRTGDVDNNGRSIAECWRSGSARAAAWDSLTVAALRAVGIPARLGADGQAQSFSSGQWIKVPDLLPAPMRKVAF